jgi:hypothetical protein
VQEASRAQVLSLDPKSRQSTGPKQHLLGEHGVLGDVTPVTLFSDCSDRVGPRCALLARYPVRYKGRRGYPIIFAAIRVLH